MRNSIIVFLGLADPEEGILCEPVQHVQPHLQAGPLRLHFPSGKGEEHYHHKPLQGWGSLKMLRVQCIILSYKGLTIVPQIPFLKTWISLGQNSTDKVTEKEVIYSGMDVSLNC